MKLIKLINGVLIGSKAYTFRQSNNSGFSHGVGKAILLLLFIIFISSQGIHAQYPQIFSDFLTPTTSQTTPTCLSNCGWFCVFDDEFPGTAIDRNKWVNPPTHGAISYDDGGANAMFIQPGINLRDIYYPTAFSAYDCIYCSASGCPAPCASVLEDGYPNLRNWNFTSTSLNSAYTFPSTGQTGQSYGIYVLTAILPGHGTPLLNDAACNPSLTGNNTLEPPYGCYQNPYWGNGAMDVAWWEFGSGGAGNYSEMDGFEFGNSPWQDDQTSHSSATTAFGVFNDPGGIDFSDAATRTFYLIETPDEHDWWINDPVQGYILSRSDAKYYYYYEGDFFPYTCNSSMPGGVQFSYNTAFSEPPWQLLIGQGMYPEAYNIQSNYPNLFPIEYKIYSVKYYQYFGDLSQAPFQNVTVDQTMLNEGEYSTNVIPSSYPNAELYNVFVGQNINLTGTSAYPIIIPHYKYSGLSWLGQLKLIAENEIVLSGPTQITISGFFEAKLEGGNTCGDYTGPPPINSASFFVHGPTRNDSNSNKAEPADSLAMEVAPSSSRGQYILTLTNIAGVALGQNADVSVYNILGQQFFHGNIIVEDGNTLPINLTGKASGVYLVVLRTNYTVIHKNIILP